MNIGDFVDKIITIILGIVVIIIAFKPSLFSKKQDAVEKMKKFKIFFIIGGLLLVGFGILQIYMISTQ